MSQTRVRIMKNLKSAQLLIFFVYNIFIQDNYAQSEHGIYTCTLTFAERMWYGYTENCGSTK